jgi:nucleoside phosphorylase
MSNSTTNILIVTVTEVEGQAVLNAFQSATQQKARAETHGDRVYQNLGRLNNSQIFMANSEIGSQGLGAAQQTAQKAIAALRPQAVFAVGIMFGINKEKQEIGEILVSQQLMPYELQRVGKREIILRDDRPHSSPALINFLKSAKLTWQGSKVHFGSLLSGEKLVDNLDYRNNLRKLASEAIGGEMEGAGIYVSCQDAKVDWIVVKAICDWADGNKSQGKDEYQKLAADNAAKFIVHALQHAPLPRLSAWTDIENSRPTVIQNAEKIYNIEKIDRAEFK